MMILTFEDDEKELFQNMVNYVNDKMETVVTFGNIKDKYKHGDLQIDIYKRIVNKGNKTAELVWANTWNENIENDTFTISLNNILKENEYVIRLVGTEINYAKIEVIFESDLVQERERPRKSN